MMIAIMIMMIVLHGLYKNISALLSALVQHWLDGVIPNYAYSQLTGRVVTGLRPL